MDGKINLLAKSCGLDADVLKNYFKIKICSGRATSEDCINDKDPIFSYGDVTPCGFESADAKKFLGCGNTKYYPSYTIVTATNQQKRGRV